MAIDSKLRGCDLVKLRVSDISHGLHISKRAMIVQQKTGRSVQFELTKQTMQMKSIKYNYMIIQK